MVGRLEGEDQEGLLVVVDAVDACLMVVDDAQIGRVETGLTDGPHRLRGRKEIGKAEHGATPEPGSVLQSHPRLDDHAEGAFRADDHAVGARPGSRTGQAARFHGARRRDGADAFDEVVDMGPKRGEVPARPGRDPAAERGKLEALRIVPDREAMRLQRRLDRWASDAGLDARGPTGAVDFEDTLEPTQIEADDARIAVANGRLDAPDDRGAASEGNDGDVRSARPVEHRAHVRFPRGKSHEVRRVGEVAGIGANGLRIRLAVRMQEPLVGVALEHVGNRVGRRHTRLAQADVRHLRRGDEVGFDAKTIGDEAEQPLPFCLVEPGVVHAPAIELQAATHDAIYLDP